MPCSVLTVPLPTLSGEQIDGLDVQQIERDAGAHDIGDRIGRAHFVEVDLLDGHLVDLRLGFAEFAEDARWRCAWRGSARFARSIILMMWERWRWVLVSCTATRYLVAPMPQRLTFSKDTAAPASSEAMASVMAA